LKLDVSPVWIRIGYHSDTSRTRYLTFIVPDDPELKTWIPFAYKLLRLAMIKLTSHQKKFSFFYCQNVLYNRLMVCVILLPLRVGSSGVTETGLPTIATSLPH